MGTTILEKAQFEGWTDEQVVERVLDGETALYEIIMRCHNQRIYRTVRAILRDDGEAEDVTKDAYVCAHQHLRQIEGRSAFSTWLTRIAVHEALARLRQRGRLEQLDTAAENGGAAVKLSDKSPDPEQITSRAQLSQMLEDAVLSLPEAYRCVIMLRDVEELSTSETAAALNLSEENVKVRLHRGRAMMRRDMYARVGATAKDAFPFMGTR